MHITLSKGTDITPRTRYTVALFAGIAAIFQLSRITLLCCGAFPVSAFMQSNFITSLTFFGTTFYLILWAGGLLLLESAKILLQMSQANKRLEQLALQDELTGLLNRHSLDQSIKTEVERQDRYMIPLSAVMIDVDHFKLVNDTFGHDAGDRILVEIARRIRATIRENDMLFRWGGEEFLILALNTGYPVRRRLPKKSEKLLR